MQHNRDTPRNIAGISPKPIAKTKSSTSKAAEASPFELGRPDQIYTEQRVDSASARRRQTQKQQSSNQRSHEAQYQRSTSEITPTAEDCLASEKCIWKKRFMDLVREKEQISQKFKESLSQYETKFSILHDEKIAAQNSKKSLEDLIKQQTNALLRFRQKFDEQQAKIRLYESQRGAFSTADMSQSPVDQQSLHDQQHLQPPIMFQQRQSEMIKSVNKPLHSEIGLATSGYRGQNQSPQMLMAQKRVGSPAFNTTSNKEEDIRIPLTVAGGGDTPGGTATGSSKGGIPQVVIMEERSKNYDSGSDSSSKPIKRASDFSLSNIADVNDRGEITPLRQIGEDDGNLTNDEIDQIECGKSCEGVEDRNNMFDQHIYTHYVQNEEKPPQPPKFAMRQSDDIDDLEYAGNDLRSQTMKAPDVPIVFKDELVKNTPSFVELDSDRAELIQLTKNQRQKFADQPHSMDQGFSASIDSNKILRSKQSPVRKFGLSSSSASSPLPPPVSSISKNASLENNAWVQIMAQKQQQQQSTDGSKAVSAGGQKDPSSQTQKSILLTAPQDQSSLHQPYERNDSDEIELKDSESGDDDNSDCEFNSLEGNARPTGSLPKSQTKFNQINELNKMNPLDCQNQRRIQEMKKRAKKAQMTRITEESSLQGTNDFTNAALNPDSSRRASPRQDLLRLQQNVQEVPMPEPPQQLTLTKMPSSDDMHNPLERQSSNAIIIDDDDEDDDIFGRDEEVKYENGGIIPSNSQRNNERPPAVEEPSSFIEGRFSELVRIPFGAPGQLEPLEAVYEDEASQVMLGEVSEQVRREPNFEGRFSTVMSDRLESSQSQLQEGSAFQILPRNFSQVPGALPEINSAVENPREVRPTTSLVENQRLNLGMPKQMSNSMSLPSNFEMSNMTGDVAVQEQQDNNVFPQANAISPQLIEENVDGEESKESCLSVQSRPHGASFVKRGTKRESEPMTLQDLASASEVDANSTQMASAAGGAFDSRQLVSDFPMAAKKQIGLSNQLVVNGDSGIDMCSSNAHTRGNDSAQTAPKRKTTDQKLGVPAVQMGMYKQESFGTPHNNYEKRGGAGGDHRDGFTNSFQSNNMFYPVQVSEKSDLDRYGVGAMGEEEEQAGLPSPVKIVAEAREDDSSFVLDELNREPTFFRTLSKNTTSDKNNKDGSSSNLVNTSNIGQQSLKHGLSSEDVQIGQNAQQKQPYLSNALMNRSMHVNKFQNSMIIDSRRTSEHLLIQPRSSFVNFFGNKQSKQLQAMHASILNESKGKGIGNLNKGADVPFGVFEPAGQIRRRSSSKRSRGDRKASLAARSNTQVPCDSEDDDKPPVYELPVQSEEKMQRMQRMTKNQKQNHSQFKQSHILKQSTNTTNNQKGASQAPGSASVGLAGIFNNKPPQLPNVSMLDDSDSLTDKGKTGESAQLLAMTEEFGGKNGNCKKQQPKLTIPLSNTIFETLKDIPIDFRKSFVSMGDSSPIADESPHLRTDTLDFQSSPRMTKKATYFTRENHSAKVQKVGNNYVKESSLGQRVVSHLGKLGKVVHDKLIGRAEEDLLWFARLIENRTIQSDYYFEKYMVVGLSDETLSAEQAKHDFRQCILNPSILFREPAMSRQTSNFNERKYLIDEDTVDTIADFCFPNGVPVIQMVEFEEGVPFEKQSQKTRVMIEEIFYKQKDIREDMFFFQLDASDAVELQDGEVIYGDCSLSALVHTFSDFKELNGKLYAVKSAICFVTNSQTNFNLLFELIDKNMQIIRSLRMQQYCNPMLDLSTYTKEIKSCLQIRYESPPDDLIVLLQLIQYYKINNPLREPQEESDAGTAALECSEVVLEHLDFRYEFPRSFQRALADRQPITMKDIQMDLTEQHWHLPTFFSLFGPDTFYKLITAVLLERSIVFVHQHHQVLSSVILALKTLLRPFMWCHQMIPILPKALLDRVEQPLPVLVGITITDYEECLRNMTEKERKFKTWVFLDWELAEIIGNDPDCMPFETQDNQDVDDRSGVRIVWGTMDQEFSSDWRQELLLGWLDEMKSKTKRYFDEFEHVLRSEGLGADSLLPGVLGSFDMQFENQRIEEQNQKMMLSGEKFKFQKSDEVMNRQSLGEKIKSNRKKPSQSMDFSNEMGGRQSQRSPEKHPAQALGLATQGSTDEDQVNQRESVPGGYDDTFEQRRLMLNEVHGTTETINEVSDTAEQATGSKEMEQQALGGIAVSSRYMPLVILGNDKLKNVIEQICLQLARTYKHKIIDLVPELCKLCDITEADQDFDCDKIAEKITQVPGSERRDEMFLQQFAYTQMFSFLLENYIAALNEKQMESEMGDFAGKLPLSRQSDYVLGIFSNAKVGGLYSSVDVTSGSRPWGLNPLASQDSKPIMQMQSHVNLGSNRELILANKHMTDPQDKSLAGADSLQQFARTGSQGSSLQQILHGKSSTERASSRASGRQ